jgi:chromosome segregation protein
MFLKRIDISGFKSFADKTGVEFSPGITAVVGPNGSGKSNIADAIRWVLGEQSARSLRGAKMEDVIFAGSVTRKSINFCEVSLTLDNGDKHLPVVFDEVTVTRRVYRSGESEYLINSTECRLKDIHELFMDSGLGRESYSIIGQGRIEEMLSTRPEDRRGPFEDAAGIVKFKFRRKEAERKLDETTANLLRVGDILAELAEQAGPLEADASRAKAHQQLANQLNELDIALLVSEIETQKARFQAAAALVSQWSVNRIAIAEEVAKLDKQMQRTRIDLDSRTTQIDTVQSRYVEAVMQREKTEGERALLLERTGNLKRDLLDKEARTSELLGDLNAAKGNIEKIAADGILAETRFHQKQSELDLVTNRLDLTVKDRIEQNIKKLNIDMIELHHQAATYRNEVKTAEESLASDDRKKERYNTEREKWTKEINHIGETVREGTAMVETMKDQMTALQKELENATAAYREGARKEADLVGTIHQVESELASLKSRFELLRDLEQGYDGYALGVKTVMQASMRGKLQGIRGSVATLLKVEKAYEQAIETALGGTVQNIVVDTEAEARKAIGLLKERQAGRATFMPLDVIRSRLLSRVERDKVSHVLGFVGLGSELVTTLSPYAQIVEYLLGNVVIAEKLVHANDLAKRLGYRVRIVTLEGDVVSPGGVMSGGSHTRKGPGLLGRSRERADVEALIEQRSAAKTTLLESQEMLRNQTTLLQQNAAILADELRNLEQDIQKWTKSVGENQVQLGAANERLSALEWEWTQLTSGQNAVKVRAIEAAEHLEQVEELIVKAGEDIEQERKALAAFEKFAEEAREQVTRLRVDTATLAKERDTLRERRAEITSQIRQIKERMAQLGNGAKDAEALLIHTNEQIEAAELAIHSSFTEVAEMEKNLSDMKQARFGVELEAQSTEKQLRTKQLSLTEIDETLHRAEVSAERADVELNHTLMKMSEVYQMTYEWAKEHYPLADSVESVRKIASQLQREIRELGEVNPGAIDEWQRLSDRIEFLSGQRMDLTDAIEQLDQVIAEIDEEMSRRFLVTFEKIRTEFQVAFRQLFNGGSADLQLMNPNDLLSTGIEVIAEPPGKKLQNLNLMSGGERALTAMALLFAILRVRPVPFCVLDEVEAALDEANVGRFAKQLRVFCAETQFIVITHRRGTMEEADVLYGVTMQESGVSSMIGVRLSDEADFETA